MANDIPDDHPSQDRTARFPRDARLRAFGFCIAHRRDREPAVWAKDGKEYLEREALVMCQLEGDAARKRVQR